MTVDQVSRLIGKPLDREMVPANGGQTMRLSVSRPNFSGDAVFIAPGDDDVTPYVFVDGKLLGWEKHITKRCSASSNCHNNNMLEEKLMELERKVQMLLEVQGVQWQGELTSDQQERSCELGKIIFDLCQGGYIVTGEGLLSQTSRGSSQTR